MNDHPVRVEETLKALPCPFCAAAAREPWRNTNRHKNDGEWDICCTGCDAEIRMSMSARSAIAAWNTRAPHPIEMTIEAVGRIVDPEAWIIEPWTDAWRGVLEKRRARALSQGAAILALTHPDPSL